jgi:Protein of unknown function (DUF2975)
MKISTMQMLKMLYLLSWIIFVGLCILAGGLITNAFVTLVVNPVDAKYFWKEIDLSVLFKYDHGHFLAEILIIIIVTVMKAYLFYLIIKILHNKKLDMAQPFGKEVGRFIFKLSYGAVLIGLFSWYGAKYAEWLAKQGVKMPDIQYLQIGGADVWLFMSVILFVIAHIFKRGIEIQTENELTI